MKTVELSLLGPFKAQIGEQPLTRFRTQKLQALFIYLTVENVRIHRRETLLGLLWPDLPQKSARDTLRQTLSLLRKLLPPQLDANGNEIPFLLSDRQTVQIHPDYPLSLDLHQFIELSESGQQQNNASLLQQAIDRVQGEFLSDFYLADSNSFEEWAERSRTHTRQLILETMRRLTAVYLEENEFGRAEHTARRQLEFDNLNEEAHRQLMMALAQNGRRHDALNQYDMLHKLLWDELGLAPEPVTQDLLTQIETGQVAFSKTDSHETETLKQHAQPIFLTMAALTPASEHDKFVARTAELDQLHTHLQQAVAGQGQVLFVTGEAGQGKSALLQAFMKQAIEQQPTLLAADGICSDISGGGEPYLPIRQWLTMLLGDLESKWGLGSVSGKWARRLWQAAPTVKAAILQHGSHLPGTLISTSLIDNTPQNDEVSLTQQSLFSQITAVLQNLAAQSPLLLVLDDMQWADSSTIGFLFHLGRQLAQVPILIVCAYRPSDVALGHGSDRHPLEAVVQEFGRIYGNTAVSLEETNNQAFVEALIDSQPNQLDADFRHQLFQQTGGHALFTVELLRELRDQGNLKLNQDIKWALNQQINWGTIPAKVEATVAERIERLPDQLRALLKIAAVEGATFTAELIADIQQLTPLDLVQSFSSQLDQQHRLVEVVGVDRFGTQRLSRYRFRHNLIYHYLRSQLDPVEKVYLHEAMGNALLKLAGAETSRFASQLATHFEEAGLIEKALFFAAQAGEEAARLSAPDEARDHYQQALTLLQLLPHSPERAEKEKVFQKAILF